MSKVTLNKVETKVDPESGTPPYNPFGDANETPHKALVYTTDSYSSESQLNNLLRIVSGKQLAAYGGVYCDCTADCSSDCCEA